MLTYDPNVSDLATPMPVASASVEPPPQNESTSNKRTVPTGLLRDTEPEKNLDESQMAEFSSSIEEVMPGPGQMMQDEVQGSPYEQAPPQKQSKSSKGSSGSSKNPFGLTDEQWYAALAGVAAVIAYSKPVQGKLSTMVPKFLGENGEMSMTGMAVTALIAAIVFYFARQFLGDKV
jgi:hypothetical protein